MEITEEQLKEKGFIKDDYGDGTGWNGVLTYFTNLYYKENKSIFENCDLGDIDKLHINLEKFGYNPKRNWRCTCYVASNNGHEYDASADVQTFEHIQQLLNLLDIDYKI